MRKYYILTIFTIILMLLNPIAVVAKETGPRLYLSSDEYHFQELFPRQENVVLIPLTNQGTASLEIKDLTTTCQCIKVAMDEKIRILSGETYWLEVRLVTKDETSFIKGYLLLATNELTTPLRRIKISGRIKNQKKPHSKIKTF